MIQLSYLTDPVLKGQNAAERQNSILEGRHPKELEEAVAAAVATAEAREERGAAEAALRAQMADERRRHLGRGDSR